MVRGRSLSDVFNGPSVRFDFFRLAATRIAHLQFRPGTFYSVSKPYVPVVALIGVWSMVLRTKYRSGSLFYETVSIRHLFVGILLIGVWLLICRSFVAKQSRPSYLRETLPVLLASMLCGLGQAAVHIFWPTHHSVISGSELVCWMLGTYLFLLCCSWLVSEHLIPIVTAPRLTLIVGTGPQGRALRRELTDDKRYRVIGTLDDEFLGTSQDEASYLGELSRLSSLLKREPVEIVLIALPIKSMYSTILGVIRTCETIGVDASYVSNMFETGLIAANHEMPDDRHHLTVLTMHRPDFRRLIKGMLDFAFALLLLIAIAPLLLIIAIAIKFTSPGPIIFSQIRYGVHRNRFSMLKFRTMVIDAEVRQAELERLNEADGPVFKIKKDPRVTPVGNFLRKTSLDELPQLFNVLRGEMSLVGPRPLPLRDVDKFDQSWFLRRFSVKPGLTCLWQATGRSNISFDEWIRLDLQYIDRWSLLMDLKILVLTIPAVLRGSGAS